MKNFLIAFSVFLVWSVFGIWLYSILQSNGDMVAERAKTSDINNEIPSEIKDPIEAGDKDSLSIIPTQGDSLIVSSEIEPTKIISKNALKATTLNDEILFLYPDGISINKNSPEIYIPDTAIDFKYKLNSYLIEHPDQELHILSLYSAKENAQDPNLGIQRGNKIKEILVSIGMPASKLVVKPVIKAIDFDVKGSFENSISFAFRPLDENRLAALKSKVPESITIYPRYSANGLLLSKELSELLEKVNQIVNENPDITVEIIGHTDNVGNATDNYLSGLEYARQIRWYLVTKGDIDSKNIKAISKGESDPIDSNKSVSGRKNNQRIEVKFY